MERNGPCSCGSGKKAKKCCARPLPTPKREPVVRQGGANMRKLLPMMMMFAGMGASMMADVNGRSKSNRRK